MTTEIRILKKATCPTLSGKSKLTYHILKHGEIMLFITLAVTTGLFLLLPPTRLYAVIDMGLLLYLYPFLTIGLLLIAGVAYYYIREKFL